MSTYSSSLKEFATLDSDRQVVIVTTLFTSMLSPLPANLTREVRFDQIESVYLDLQEESHMVPDRIQGDYGYSEHFQLKRSWILGVQLRSGETVSLYKEITDQPAGEASNLSLQRSYWESLAARISSQLDKPLMRLAPAASPPRTFIEAIDQILQRRLEQSGLAQRSVHVRGKGLGAQIWVDSKVYSTLDEVMDQDARSLIQSAIDEWQSSVP